MSTPKQRLEYIRGEIEAERISYAEIHELQSLAIHIHPNDVLLLQWAGVPEGMTPKRQAELDVIAKQVYADQIANLLPKTMFDDDVSLCVEVKQRYGDDLTIDEAEYVQESIIRSAEARERYSYLKG